MSVNFASDLQSNNDIHSQNQQKKPTIIFNFELTMFVHFARLITYLSFPCWSVTFSPHSFNRNYSSTLPIFTQVNTFLLFVCVVTNSLFFRAIVPQNTSESKCLLFSKFKGGNFHIRLTHFDCEDVFGGMSVTGFLPEIVLRGKILWVKEQTLKT